MTLERAFHSAKELILDRFPSCHAALLSGSVIRGQETATSDLDIIVIHNELASSYRESLIWQGWPVELFVHNSTGILDFFKDDCLRGRPSLPRMIAEGLPLKSNQTLDSLKVIANRLLSAGPESWDEDTIDRKRYFLTDALDDFNGCNDRGEGLFIAGHLAELLHEFVLRTNGCWIGSSKWIVRALKKFDPEYARHFVHAFDSYYKHGEKKGVITLVNQALSPFGGRLFEGFSIGKPLDGPFS
ncbi:nucleotidyltransferase domain-containing protein [Rossellomorea marisflavi]|uniref:nucleotidyltransferase domain-containing protein n=1 Tax=Rossellomorea marisflavi TaxID=189381 RepID=UPI004044F53D